MNLKKIELEPAITWKLSNYLTLDGSTPEPAIRYIILRYIVTQSNAKKKNQVLVRMFTQKRPLLYESRIQ